MKYWDTSALLKLYVTEPDSPYFLDLVAHGVGPIVTADITRVEMLCALHRKEHARDIRVGAAETLFDVFSRDIDLGHIAIVLNGPRVMTEAKRLVGRAYSQKPPRPIRNLDARHVASAIASNTPAIVATDARLRDVAKSMGLLLEPQPAVG